MCKAGGKKVVLIDFGWARHLLPGQKVKRGAHEIADALGRPATFNDLVVAETANLEEGFGVRGSEAYKEAIREWNDLDNDLAGGASAGDPALSRW